MRSLLLAAACTLGCLCHGSRAQSPLETAFAFQGELRSAGIPASGAHDVRFRLFDAEIGGTQFGGTLCLDYILLSEGRFTVMLDFGDQFAGQQRFLEIQVRPDTGLGCGNPNGFVTLAPRQELAPSPNALFSLNAGTAANASTLSGHSESFFRDASNISVGTLSAQRLPPNGITSAHLAFDSSSLPNVSGGMLAVSGPRLGIGTGTPTAAIDMVASTLNDPFTMRLRTEPAGAVRLGLGSSANSPSLGSEAASGRLDLYGFKADPETPVMIHNEMAGQGSFVGFARWPILIPPPRIGTPYGAGPGGLEIHAGISDVLRLMNDSGSDVRLVLGDGGGAISDPYLRREPNGDLGLYGSAGITLGAVSSLPHILFNQGGTESLSLTANGLSVMTAGSFTIDQFSSLPHLRFGSGGLNYIGLDQAGQPYTFAFPGGTRFMGGNVGIGVASPTAKLHVGGTAGVDGIRFPDGSLQVRAAKILRGNSNSIDIPTLAAGSSIAVGFGFSGAVVGDAVLVSPVSDLGNGVVVSFGRVSVNGTIEFRVQNVTGGVINPPPSVFAIAIIQ